MILNKDNACVIFECRQQRSYSYNPPIETKVFLFEEGFANKCIELDEHLIQDLVPETPRHPYYNNKLICNDYNGLVMESCDCTYDMPNVYYHLVRCNDDDGDSIYEWKSICNQYGIDSRSLMCNVNENIFICDAKQRNYLYNFENET